MRLNEAHEAERQKWDAIAEQNRNAALAPPRDADFEAFARQSGRLVGVADFLGDLRGRRVLEYGCGLGETSVLLARSGADVFAFDISPTSVALTGKRARSDGVEVEAMVAAGEALPHATEFFDVVFGTAVLHHLDPEVAAPELRRVLKSGGKAVFAEPLGTNPLLRFARDHLPYPQKTPRGADRPLTYDDLRRWGEGFGSFSYREVQLFSMTERLLGYRKRIPPLRRLDDVLLTRFPALRPLCRYVVLYMVK